MIVAGHQALLGVGAGGPSYDDLVSGNPNLIFRAQLRETSGTTAVDSVGGNNGAYYDDFDLESEIIREGGTASTRFGASSNGGIEILTGVPAITYANPFTVKAWVKFYACATHGLVIGNFNNSALGRMNFRLGFSKPAADAFPEFMLSESPAGTPHNAISSTAAVVGQVYQLTGVWDPNLDEHAERLSLFVDAGLEDSDGAVGMAAVMASNGRVYIGGDFVSPLAYRLNGTIADVEVYDYAMPAATIAEHYLAGS